MNKIKKVCNAQSYKRYVNAFIADKTYFSYFISFSLILKLFTKETYTNILCPKTF